MCIYLVSHSPEILYESVCEIARMHVYICVCMYVCMDLSVRFANMMNLAQTTLEMLSCFIQSKMQFSSLNFYSNLRFSLITFEVFVESKLGNN